MQNLKCLPQVPSTILLFLPPGPHGPPHFVRSLLLRPQNAIFLPSKNHLVFCFRFFSIKHRKSWICASPNHPKTFPKCLRNRCPKKHAIFHWCLLEKCFVAKAPTSISYWFFQCFLLVGHFSSNRIAHAFWIQKTYQKTIQNESETFENRYQKQRCFVTSIFARFSFDFGRSWPSNLKPSWTIRPTQRSRRKRFHSHLRVVNRGLRAWLNWVQYIRQPFRYHA